MRLIELALFVAGLLSLGLFASSYGINRVQAGSDVAAFTADVTSRAIEPEMALWSERRIRAYEGQGQASLPVIGVIRVQRLSIEAPIYVGTNALQLDRGVGWIAGTASPGTQGNVGLAGHRDGFFRGLKDIEIDDVIHISSPTGDSAYRVSATEVVKPSDVYVLEPTLRDTLTIVTCHPFYYVGSAPNRFVVFATRV